MTIFSLLLATVISAGIVPRQPKFSMFASDVFDAAKTSGHTVRETVSKLKAVGITGFDAEYCGRTIDELKAAGLEPVNFYGFMKFLAQDGGRAQSEAFLAAAVRHGVKRIMIVPDEFTDGGDREAEYAKMRDGMKALVSAAKEKDYRDN